MIGLPSYFRHQFAPFRRKQPEDTGCVFPFGVGGKDVRIWLLTDNPLNVGDLRARLLAWGLPEIRRFLRFPQMQAMLVTDPFSRPAVDPVTGQRIPKILRWGDDPLMLESQNPDDLVRFMRWFHEKREAAERAKPPKAKSLTELADDGEIETIDAA